MKDAISLVTNNDQCISKIVQSGGNPRDNNFRE
jgi:hypothetical protein